MSDAVKVGQVAAELMESLTDDLGQVTVVAVVCEIDTGEGTDIIVQCSDKRPWVQAALLQQGISTVEDAE